MNSRLNRRALPLIRQHHQRQALGKYMEISLDQVKQILGDVLQLGSRVASFDQHTPLLGSVPEFDSMAVVSVITAIEDDFGITLDDDEISADIFLTVGDLHAFLHAK